MSEEKTVYKVPADYARRKKFNKKAMEIALASSKYLNAPELEALHDAEKYLPMLKLKGKLGRRSGFFVMTKTLKKPMRKL